MIEISMKGVSIFEAVIRNFINAKLIYARLDFLL